MKEENVIIVFVRRVGTVLSNIDNSILKELDKQRFKSDVISLVMEKLNSNEKKDKFLSFMIDNRNVMLSFKEIFNEIKEY